MKNLKAFGYRPVDLVLVSSLSGGARYVTAKVAAKRDLAAALGRLVPVTMSCGS